MSISESIEWFVRQLFARLGSLLDRVMGGEVARDETLALTQRIEKEIEKQLRRESGRIVAPHVIELIYEYEAHLRTPAPRREALQRRLRAEIYEYILNHRYTTLGPLEVKISKDAFAQGLKIKLGFGDAPPVVNAQPAATPTKAPARSTGGELMLRAANGAWQARVPLTNNGAPVGVGRNSQNAVMIDDPTVSSFHAAFVLQSDGTLTVADRDSSNGTYVNGVMLDPAGRTTVHNGDRVQFGDFAVTVEIKVRDE